LWQIHGLKFGRADTGRRFMPPHAFALALPLALFAFAQGGVAMAADVLPVINIDKTCATESGAQAKSAIPQVGNKDSCIRSETDARDKLKEQWAQFPADDRDHCARLAQMAIGSYVEMLTCLEMARDARKLPADSTMMPAKKP
jgi:hypothetical protein